jgi:hypothetical protein
MKGYPFRKNILSHKKKLIHKKDEKEKQKRDKKRKKRILQKIPKNCRRDAAFQSQSLGHKMRLLLVYAS